MILRLKRLLTGNMKTRAKKSHLKARYLPAPQVIWSLLYRILGEWEPGQAEISGREVMGKTLGEWLS